MSVFENKKTSFNKTDQSIFFLTLFDWKKPTRKILKYFLSNVQKKLRRNVLTNRAISVFSGETFFTRTILSLLNAFAFSKSLRYKFQELSEITEKNNFPLDLKRIHFKLPKNSVYKYR